MGNPPYVVRDQFGDCMVCGEYHDLRCGACFDCADKVDGEFFPDKGYHELWVRDNPKIRWIVPAHPADYETPKVD